MPDPKSKRPSRPMPTKIPRERPSRPSASGTGASGDPHDETTARNVLSPELLENLRDESEKVTVRRRIVIGPDGMPRVLDDDDDVSEDETTRRIATQPRDDD